MNLPHVGGQIDARSPYRHGDRVQLHGYPGSPAGPLRDGWRGTVIGGFGNKALIVLTDDSRQAVENWAHLTRDGELEKTAAYCTCCRAHTVQLDLFGAAA